MARRKVKPYDISQPYQRTFDFPLDWSSVFYSFDDALKYAQGKGDDERKLGKTAYLGQLISVIDESRFDVKIYKIVYDSDRTQRTLALVGEGGGGGGAVIEKAIHIGDKTIPIGASLTDAADIIAGVVNENDGKLSDDIIIDGEVIAHQGDTLTEALQDVATYLFSHSGSIAKIESLDTDLKITSTGDTTYLQVTGISNGEIEIS